MKATAHLRRGKNEISRPTTLFHDWLMMFVEADAFNVVPYSGLMTEETLVDLGIRLSADRLIDHSKMFHVMARWRLMTLGA